MTDPMQLYKKIEAQGRKAEADAFMADLSSRYTADHPAPNEEIAKGLEGILAMHKPASDFSMAGGLAMAASLVALASGYFIPFY